MPLPENILDISQAHLQQLIADREPEGPQLDFQRELPPTWNDQAKHDFASDASAFANAGGGYLIYGLVQDDEGCAATLVPQNFNPDTDAMRRKYSARQGGTKNAGMSRVADWCDRER
jgi:predicted HTH transcriptional regulator